MQHYRQVTGKTKCGRSMPTTFWSLQMFTEAHLITKLWLNFKTMLSAFHNYYGYINLTGLWQQSITPGFWDLSII